MVTAFGSHNSELCFFTLASAAESFQEGRDRAKRSIEHIG